MIRVLLGLGLLAVLVLAASRLVPLPSWSPPSLPGPSATRSSESVDPVSGLAWVRITELPDEARNVYTLIGKGGPFRYGKDGAPFSNRERLLPRQPSGYYREYTVDTPQSNDRGARRIVCGGQPRTSRAECYYTADHYLTFRRIAP